MEGVAQINISDEVKDSASSHELRFIFERYLDRIQVLSLDCFDTLLFRKTATPADVFYELQHSPMFQKLNFTPVMRINNESRARKMNTIKHYQSEVSLKDIYVESYPEISEALVHQLEEEELSAEMNMCYAFTPIIELIKLAHSKGIAVIIVSDTYFSAVQLKRLLSKHLSSDVMAMIKEVFCSSDYGRLKGFGLFKIILEKLALAPDAVLHIGDNQFADFIAPKQERMHAIHFSQLTAEIEELLRMQALAANQFDQAIRDKKPLYSPFKALFAKKAFSNKPEEMIGYASLGPILYGFGQFILSELADLKASGKNLKIAFLMRDAFLPSQVMQVLGESNGKCINLSRFASIAASLRTQEDIDHYLLTILSTERFEDMAHQLLIPDYKATALANEARAARDKQRKFVELIHQPDLLREIFHASKQYFQRLYRYLQNEIGLQQGDTLVLIDLGYTGTTQKVLAPIFKTELNIDVFGRYLISLSQGGEALARRGLMDESWCDARSMHALIEYIALFEQLCTSNTNSVVDYQDDGTPIFSSSKIDKAQHSQLERIQASCLEFIRDAMIFFNSAPFDLSLITLKEMARAELGRMLFFPTALEVQYLESFQFETNLGTNDIFKMYDQKKGIMSLRSRGVFSTYMEKHGATTRLNKPAEMRAAGLELAVMIFSHHRYGLQLKTQDATLRTETIEVVIIQNNQGSHTVLPASATFDGYYALTIPMGSCDFQIGLLFGKKYQWIEFSSIQRIDLRAYLSEKESLFTEEYFDRILTHQMVKHADKLFECQTTDSLVLIPPGATSDHSKKYILRVIFRPIVMRGI